MNEPTIGTKTTRRLLPNGAPHALLLSCAILVGGCGRHEFPAAHPSNDTAGVSNAPLPAPDDPLEPAPGETLEDALHAALRRTNPSYSGAGQFQVEGRQLFAADLAGCGLTDLSALRGTRPRLLDLRQNPVSDLTPLTGMPLIELYLEETRVRDLRPLTGMPLAKLYLSHTPVEDLAPLRGMPLLELNLLGTRARDLEPLRALPLEMLWLTETPVDDIAPLAECPLVSLTLHRTQVRDLRPLSGNSLQRLHIGETPVSDLTPLGGMRLTRLIFDPSRITRGLDTARQMTSIHELGLTFEDRMSPAEFWSRFPPASEAP